MKVRKDVMLKAVREDFNATDLAGLSCKKGTPFEKLIVYLVMLFITALKITKWLEDLIHGRIQQMSDLFEEDIYEAHKFVNLR